MDQMTRIARLERDNRRFKQLGIVSILLLCIAASAGAIQTASPTDLVTTKRLEVIDNNGIVRALIGDVSAGNNLDEFGVVLFNKDGKRLSSWHNDTFKNMTFDFTTVDGGTVLSLTSSGSTVDGSMAGFVNVKNLWQNADITIGRTGAQNGTGIRMGQSDGAGGGRVVSTWSFSKDKSSSLILGDGIEIERAVLSAPADKAVYLQLGDKAVISGGNQ